MVRTFPKLCNPLRPQLFTLPESTWYNPGTQCSKRVFILITLLLLFQPSYQTREQTMLKAILIDFCVCDVLHHLYLI